MIYLDQDLNFMILRFNRNDEHQTFFICDKVFIHVFLFNVYR